jgi:hypothetical protein
MDGQQQAARRGGPTRWARRAAGSMVAVGILVAAVSSGAPAAATGVAGVGSVDGRDAFADPSGRVIFNICVFVPWCDPPGPPK